MGEKQMRGESALVRYVVALVSLALFLLVNWQNQNIGSVRRAMATEKLKLISKIVNRGNKPVAVVHIGPPKTGTTSIQHRLQDEFTRETLAKDGYVYIGRELGQLMQACDGEPYKGWQAAVCHFKHCMVAGKCEAEVFWTEFVDNLQSLRRNGTSIIISDEALIVWMSGDQQHSLDSLHAALAGFDVHIVSAYRRFTEWLPSLYQQRYKIPRVDPRIAWLPSFAAFSQSDLYVDKHLTRLKIDFWSSAFSTVEIFNMHQHKKEELDSDFICGHIPGATETCRLVKSLPAEKAMNTGLTTHAFEARRVAVAAISAGLVQAADMDEILRIMRKSGRYANRNEEARHALQPRCPSYEELKPFLEMAIDIEAKLLPAFHNSTEGRPMLEANYGRSVSEQRYCSVNVTEALGHPSWRKFFGKLSNKTVAR